MRPMTNSSHISSSDEAAGESPKKIVSDNQETLKCIFCLRKNCNGCPLPFEDKLTLRSFLERSKAPLKLSSYFKEDDEI